jgi:molybdate transport system substrate-binding protein
MPPRAAAILAALALALPVPWAAAAERVTVFAAASLGDALAEIAAGFEADTGHRVALSLAGSAALARQIEAGAGADIYVSAAPVWMDALEEAGRIAPGTRTDVAGNALVLIGPAGAAPVALTAQALTARLGGGRLALGLTEAVPAGQYARAALEAMGLWPALAQHLVEADNVRAALALVALGAAPLGIVYASDASAEPRVAVLARIPARAHPPIAYPAALIAGRDGPAARAFLALLAGPAGQATLAAHGFLPPG